MNVFSTDKKDVGSQSLDMVAQSKTDTVHFKVIVLFSSLDNSFSAVKILKISNTNETNTTQTSDDLTEAQSDALS